MRELLKTYVRSLAEREHAADAPHRYQDLGTFVCWLLERRGFSLHYRAYKYEGTERRKSAGRQQYGTDVVATRSDAEGVVTLYRLVLKAGDIRREEWQPGERGSLPNDLWLAAGQDNAVDRFFVPGDIHWNRICLVAVHNGDLDKEILGSQIKTYLESMRERHGIETDWWDADRLVELALEPAVSLGEPIPALSEKADTTLFPPAARPFIDLALASSRLDFDYRAVDLLLNLLLPLEAVGPHEALRLRRAVAELSLFTGMLESESLRDGGIVVFPLLDTIERVLCRALEKVSQIANWAHHEKPVRGIFEELLAQYLTTAEVLLARLEPLLDVPSGLSFPMASERVDYPLRALRISGYLATAGLAALDVGEPHRAGRLSEALVRLWRSNPAGCLHPVTDDQIIEISLVWELWLQCGRQSEVADQARNLVERLASRNAWGLPMPGLWQQAKIPMDPEHLRTLVEAHGEFRRCLPPDFVDRGTTILSLAIYLACRLAPDREPIDLTPFLAATGGGRQIRLTYPQSWQPPDDAASQWYREEIRERGHATVYDFSAGLTAFLDRFEEVNKLLPERSPAAAWRLPVVDRMAWKLWRTPSPMARFIQHP